jgi:molybdopterin-containing oxidoreductase family iron-sulfur binding subunit
LALGDAASVHAPDLGQCGTDRAGDIKTEDVLTITGNGRSVRAPFFVLPGQAPDCITLSLGFGRRAGGLGVEIGFDAYQLRDTKSP